MGRKNQKQRVMGMRLTAKVYTVLITRSAGKGYVLSPPRQRVIINERIGSTPQENEVIGLVYGGLTGVGITAFGFSYTSTPLASVARFAQPNFSKTGINGLCLMI